MVKPTGHARRLCWLAAMVAALLLCVAPVPAAEVSIEIASRDVYVGIPFSLTITVRDYQDFDPSHAPSIPQVPGLKVLGPPSQSTQSSYQNINGVTTQSRLLQLRYSLSAAQPGQYTIPPIEVNVDGQRFRGQPITVKASKPESGDLLRVEVQAEEDAVYLGEPVNLTMRIWIKRYEDDAVINSLLFDRHREGRAVETFNRALRQAGEDFLKNPLGAPQIPNWNRVHSAIPEIYDLLNEAVEADNK